MVRIEDWYPARVRCLLSKFDLSRGRQEKTGWVLPHPGRHDEHPSVRMTVSTEGKIAMCDRTGGPTLGILHAIGATWYDLFAEDDAERAELSQYALSLRGGASSGSLPGVALEDLDLRHRVYSLMLDNLNLNDKHREQLLGRKLSTESIERNQYRTMRVLDRAKLARVLADQLGAVAGTVPGILQKGSGLVVCDRPGLLIPCRALDGRIQSLKVRRDLGEPRYSWLGEGSVCLPHHPLGQPQQAARVVVTEGELKADVTRQLTGDVLIGSPGVSNWAMVVPSIQTLQARTVVIAFDHSDDPARQKAIDQHADALADHLESLGISVEDIQWEKTSV